MAIIKTNRQGGFHPTLALKFGNKAFGAINRCKQSITSSNEYDYIRRLLRAKK